MLPAPITTCCDTITGASNAERNSSGSVGPVILRAAQAESFAAGLLEERDWVLPATLPESAFVEFGRLASSAAQPIDDVRGTAAYRRHLVAVMSRRALERVCASA